MPEFGSPFSGLKLERSLSKEELTRVVRFFIAAEYEAVQLYLQAAESTDDQGAKELLKDIAEEEVVHAGEFMKLLFKLSPEEASLYQKGMQEADKVLSISDHIRNAARNLMVETARLKLKDIIDPK